MSQGVKQPIGQKRLTNVALVRFKKKGKRFEIACYKNKVLNWRTGVEKSLDDVLQTTAVFTNVSKGILAKHEDLADVFGTQDEEQICIRILNEGDYQAKPCFTDMVSDKEREVEFESLFKDVASILAEKCVNPETSRPYTITMLERALKDIHFSVDPKHSAKQQALEVLPKLKETISIDRARMRLRCQVPKDSPDAAAEKLLDLLQSKGAVIESRDSAGPQEVVVCLIDPGCFRDVHNFVQQATSGAGQVEVVSLAVTDPGDAHSQFDAWGSSRPPSGPSAAPDGAAAGGRDNHGASSARPAAAVAPERRAPLPGTTRREAASSKESADDLLYARGPISGLPEEFSSRRERFAELDALQEGWQVELSRRRGSSAVDAVFYAPNGEKEGAFANARRAALQAHQQAAGA